MIFVREGNKLVLILCAGFFCFINWGFKDSICWFVVWVKEVLVFIFVLIKIEINKLIIEEDLLYLRFLCIWAIVLLVLFFFNIEVVIFIVLIL